MHARVGPAGPGDLDRGAEHAPGRRHDEALHRRETGLVLPAVEVGALVGDREPERPHDRGTARGSGREAASDRSANQQLGDLYAVERGPLAELVAHHPEVERIRQRDVLPDASHEAVVLALDRHRHRIAPLGGLVPEPKAGEPGEDLTCARARDLERRLGVHRDGVGREHGHADRGRRHRKIGQLQDLPHLVDELHLLARVASLAELVDVRDHVEGDLMIEELRRDGLSPRPGERLARQLLHPLHTRAGHRLIARGDHPPKATRLVQRLERHHGHDGRAVRAGEDALVAAGGVGIDLGDHERHRRVHPERARLVHHHCPRLHRLGRKLLRLRRARGEERDVDALERAGANPLDPDRLPLERDGLADGAL